MTNDRINKPQREKIEVRYANEYKATGLAWQTSRDLDKKRFAEDSTPLDIYKKALNIKDLRTRALFSILYLTGARIQEVVRYQKITWGNKKVRLISEGKPNKILTVQDYKKRIKLGDIDYSIKKEDISIKVFKDIECVVFNLRNLKNRTTKIKDIPVRLDDPINKRFYKLITDYTNTIEHPWMEIFDFGVRNGQRLIKKEGINPHYLRKIRLTHLAKKPNSFTDQQLTKAAGWTDSRPAKNYIKLGTEDIIA